MALSRTLSRSSVGRPRKPVRAVPVLWKQPAVVLSLCFLIAMLAASTVLAVVSPTPHADTGSMLLAPSLAHPMGTDSIGFDVLNRVLQAARIDLTLAVVGTVASMLVGVPIGMLASNGGRAESAIMRGIDMFQAFPVIVMALAIVALAGNDLRYVVLVIALINIPTFIRITRAEALALREARYIEAARAIGASPRRVLTKHMLPNMSGVILAQVSLSASVSIMVIAALSFLGIGVTPPAASWGAMLETGLADITRQVWWTWAFPGLAIFCSVLSFNAIADGVLRRVEGNNR